MLSGFFLAVVIYSLLFISVKDIYVNPSNHLTLLGCIYIGAPAGDNTEQKFNKTLQID